MTLKNTTERYFQGWADRDREAILDCVAPTFQFRSPLEDFDSIDAFLDACLERFGGHQLKLSSQVYTNSEGFVAYEMQGPTGPMPIAEHLRFTDGKISAVRVYFGGKLPPPGS